MTPGAKYARKYRAEMSPEEKKAYIEASHARTVARRNRLRRLGLNTKGQPYMLRHNQLRFSFMGETS